MAPKRNGAFPSDFRLRKLRRYMAVSGLDTSTCSRLAQVGATSKHYGVFGLILHPVRFKTSLRQAGL